MTDTSRKPEQRRLGGSAGHVQPEAAVIFAGIRSGTLPKGTKVRVIVAPYVSEPEVYYARPVGDGAVEALLVPVAERASEKYDGFALVLPIADLAKQFRQIDSTDVDI